MYYSKLKRIKNDMRTSMTEEKLNSLTRISTESDNIRQIDIDSHLWHKD